MFASDLFIRTYLVQNRVQYLKTHWLDVLIVALPFLRLLRVLELESVLRALRAEHGVEAAKANIRGSREGGDGTEVDSLPKRLMPPLDDLDNAARTLTKE